MTEPMGLPEQTDALILSVLVQSELPALLAAFGSDPYKVPDSVVRGIRIWRVPVKGRGSAQSNIAISCLEEKGQIDAVLRTQVLLDLLKPKYAFLVGSAAGRRGKTDLLDVVVSVDGIMYYEHDKGPITIQPKPPLKNDVLYFHKDVMLDKGWPESIRNAARMFEGHQVSLPLPESVPSVHFKLIASGEKMLDEDVIAGLADHNDDLVAGDQEGWGFAKACGDGNSWMVVRGISDFGNQQERKKWQKTATLVAATWLETFIREMYPTQIEPLPSTSPYVRESIPTLVRKELQHSGLDIGPVKFSLELNISDLEKICKARYPQLLGPEVTSKVRAARRVAFSRKYANRREEEDERFTVVGIERWRAEFREMLRHLGIQDLQSQRTIDVGVGNGLEAKGLFDRLENFTGVDVSVEALQAAKEICPGMKAFPNDAEDLASIGTGSQDLYVSLRTFTSTLFDARAALLEAYRVLRPGGSFIASVPYVFVGADQRIVKGLLLPESNQVDPDLPYSYVDKVRKILSTLDFERMQIHTGMVEIYILAERGR